MGFILEKTKDIFLLDTRVENMFINEYMTSAPGDYIKVYLFALMYTQAGEIIDNSDISKQLAIDLEDVYKAWTYWEKAGVIRKRNISGENSLEYDVEFVVLKQMLYGSQEETPVPESETRMGTKMSDQSYKSMFRRIEQALGRVISGTEMREISTWPDEYGTEPQVVAFAFEYCAGRKKKAIQYVDAVIKNWIADGYRTMDEVEKYVGAVEERLKNYKRVFQALGFHRNPTEEEKRIMDSWFDKMSFQIDTVVQACGKTAGISSPNINYVNKILENWYTDGKKTVSEGDGPAISEIMEYYEALRAGEEAEAEERRKEVYSRVPRIKEIEITEKKLNAGLSKIVVSKQIDKKEQIEKIRNEIDSLNIERALLLTDNGFELDYMDVQYKCPYCKDTGMLETGEKCQCLGEITKEKILKLKKTK